VIDAGNSRTVAAAWPGPGARPSLEAAPVPLAVVKSWGRGEDPGDLSAPAGTPVILVSVVPDETRRLAARFPDLIVVDHRCRLPFALEVADPSAVGPDRLANVAAACDAGLADALVVDAGTATTFDLLRGNRFLGGMIAPGMAFAARRLGEEAARLAPVAFGPAPATVGRDTPSAMAAGAWHAGTGGVLAVIGRILDEYGPVPVILTGGLGRHVAWPGAHHDRDWTLRGAHALAVG